MTRTAHRLGLALGLLLIATGCGLCERDTGDAQARAATAQLAALIPADTEAAFFASDWKELRNGLHILQAKVGDQAPVQPLVAQFKGGFGLDLMDVPGIQKQGVRTSGGLAVTVKKKNIMLFIPLENPATFEKYLVEHGKKTWQASEQLVTKTIEGKTIKMIVKAGNTAKKVSAVTPDALLMAWVVKDGSAIVFPGKQFSGNNGLAEIALTAHIKLPEEKTLSKVPDFATLRDTLSGKYPIFAVIDVPSTVEAEADQLAEYTHSKEMANEYRAMAKDLGWAGLGLSITDERVRLHAQALAGGAIKTRFDQAATALGDAAALSGTLENAPIVALKLAFDPAKGPAEIKKLLGSDADQLDAALGTVEKHFGVNIQTQLIPALDGQMMWVIYDAPPTLMRRPDLIGLMTTARTTISLGIKDRAKLVSAMDAAVAASGAFIKRTDKGEVALYTFADDQTRARLAVGKGVAVLGSAKITEDELVRLASGKGTGPTGGMGHKAAEVLLKGNQTSGVLLDPVQFVKMTKGGGVPGASAADALDVVLLTLSPGEKGPVMSLEVFFRADQKGQGTP